MHNKLYTTHTVVNCKCNILRFTFISINFAIYCAYKVSLYHIVYYIVSTILENFTLHLLTFDSDCDGYGCHSCNMFRISVTLCHSLCKTNFQFYLICDYY